MIHSDVWYAPRISRRRYKKWQHRFDKVCRVAGKNERGRHDYYMRLARAGRYRRQSRYIRFWTYQPIEPGQKGTLGANCEGPSTRFSVLRVLRGADFWIHDLRLANISTLAQTVPASVFMPPCDEIPLELPTIGHGEGVQIEIENRSDYAADFEAILIGFVKEDTWWRPLPKDEAPAD